MGTSVAAEKLEGAKEFNFEKLDRTYSSFVKELSPIEVGTLSIVLSSPEHSLTLENHAAFLTSLGEGEYQVLLEVSFHGGGKLDAHIQMGLIESHLEDDLLLPPQSLTLEGRLRIEPTQDGYLLTLLESSQQEVEVRIESRLAGRIVPLCKQMALVLVRLDCDALDEALSLVRVPMPSPGEVFFLPQEDLTEEEVEEFEAYLASGS